MSALKILKDGNRITYILARDNENIPLVSVENGVIKVEKKRISDLEIYYSLIAALKVAVWKFVKEHDFIEAKEALRQDE